nr:phosphotransferase [Leucobacter exalbidus]
MKVVQARRVERIVEMHAACARAGLPVPATLGWSPAGVILLENAAGTPVADAPWQPGPLLDRVDELRTRIAQVDISRPVRGVAERLDWYEQRLIGRPAVADVAIGADVTDVADIARRVRDLLAAGGAGRTPRVVHGDLHFGQLFLDGDAVSGLIDIDTMGVGDEAEDPAAFLAHATVSALLTPIGHRARVWELADLGCDRWAPDQAVRALFAVHMLGHALAAADTDDEALVQTLLRAARAVLDGGAPSECQSPADSKKPLTVSYFSA